MPNNPRPFGLCLVLLLFALIPNTVSANLVQYTYTGNLFDGDSQPYTQVTVEFTLDELLVPKNGHFALAIGSPSVPGFPLTDFRFSDGVNIIDNHPAPGYSSPDLQIGFDTDANGGVSDNWLVTVEQNHIVDGGPRPDLVSIQIQTATSLGFDLSTANSCCTDRHFVTSNIFGEWQRTLVPVPVSGSGTVFAWSLASFYTLQRFLRRKFTSSIADREASPDFCV